ncbi:MAG: LysM peptidoglycan-binding domain-containing protein [Acidimicrobiales bacterium]
MAGVQITSPDAVISVPDTAAGEAGTSEPATTIPSSVPAGPETSPPPTGATEAVSGTPYTVADGDTLWGLSNRFGVSVEALASANGLTDVDTLKPGQQLVVPDVDTVDVEVNDESD